MIYLFALLVGFLMTLAPCTLPVIGLKLRAYNGSRFPYVSGVLCSFAVIATCSLLIGSGLSLMGFEAYRAGMAIVCVLMGLHLLGVWQVPAMGLSGHYGAFGMGIMTVAVGSTCAVPFLGVVTAYTITCSVIDTYALFLCVGVGSCWYLFIPGLKIPEIFRHYLSRSDVLFGVIMLAVGIYFGWSLNPSVIYHAIALVFFWVCLTKVSGFKILPHRPMYMMFSFCVFMAALNIVQHKNTTEIPVQVIPESGPRVIMVTADWCLTCQTMKPTLHDERVVSRMNELGIVPVILDYTNRPNFITEFLASVNSKDVPILLVEGTGGDVRIFTGIWTVPELLEQLE